MIYLTFSPKCFNIFTLNKIYMKLSAGSFARNSLMVAGVAAGMACEGEEQDVTSVTRPAPIVETVKQVDRSLGNRAPFTEAAASLLSLDDVKIKTHPSKNPGSDKGPFLFFPTMHSYGDDQNLPEYREQHHKMNRQLFEAMEHLILTYDIRVFGLESTPDLQRIKETYKRSEFKRMTPGQFVEIYSPDAPAERKAIYSVALDDSLSFAERRNFLMPFLDKGYSCRMIMEAIYGDSTDIEFVSIDTSNREEVHNTVSQVVPLVEDFEQDESFLTVEDGEEMTVYRPSELRAAAEGGDKKAMFVHCMYRNKFLELIDRYEQVVHVDRELEVLANLAMREGPVLVDFGSLHTETLSVGMSELGLTLELRADALDPQAWGFENQAEFFGIEPYLAKARAQMTDLDGIKLGDGSTYSGCSQFLGAVK